MEGINSVGSALPPSAVYAPEQTQNIFNDPVFLIIASSDNIDNAVNDLVEILMQIFENVSQEQALIILAAILDNYLGKSQ